LIWWGIKDRTTKPVLLVKLALRLYEQSLCQCGHSSFLAHGPEGVGEYEARTITCHACKAREREKPTDAPGVKVYTEDLHDEPHDDEVDDEEGGDDDG
jgi:hypothetical protein